MDLIMAKIKVFEIDPYVDTKTKKVSRRFVDQLSYLRQIKFFRYRNPSIAASHILRCDGKWEIWNGNGWIECECPEIVTNIEELFIQEL